MNICLIAEGSYPYTVGGVSSWVQSLVKLFPNYEFTILTIGAEEKCRGQYKYELPDNIVGIHENFLDTRPNSKEKSGKEYHLKREVLKAFEDLICCRSIDWVKIFEFVRSKKYDNATNFLMSCDFYNIIQNVCETEYRNIPFRQVFWTAKSMLLPLLQVIQIDVPKADVYHCIATGYAGLVGCLANYLYKKPLLLTEHGIYVREREEDIVKSFEIKGYFKSMWISYFLNMARYTYECCDQVITLFSKNRETEIQYGCDSKKIKVIPNGVDLTKFQMLDGSSHHTGSINLGAFIRVVPIKDVMTMIQAFAVAKKSCNSLHLYIMGPIDEDNEYYMECKSAVESMGIADVEFTGKINTLDYINDMDIILLSSISEGQPLTMLEAMACKKPCITTDVGSCRSLLYGDGDSYGQAGYVVPVMDHMKFAEAILDLSRDDILRAKMGSAGSERVHALYSNEKLAENYTMIYSNYEE